MGARRPHLLLCGWYRPGTGFTRVLLSLLPELAQDFRITWLGVGYRGEPTTVHPGVQLLPTNLGGGDQVGAYFARTHWATLAPDLVLALNDIWYLAHYEREFQFLAQRVPMVGYLPLDGVLADAELIRELTGFSALLTYTHWAAGGLEQALRSLGSAVPVARAGHGVDRTRFHPLETCRAARMRLAQEVFGLAEPSFVVLNASRPDPRKRLDLTLDAFARFARGLEPNVRLCLHQAIEHPQERERLQAQALALGIADRILWFPPQPGPLTDVALNRLYNACAVGLNTAMGEGFGLVSFEHGACGAPQVLPAHPALVELWDQGAVLVPTSAPRSTPISPLLMAEVDTEATARALQRLYAEPEHYNALSAAVIVRTSCADLDWREVARTLCVHLQLLLSAQASGGVVLPHQR